MVSPHGGVFPVATSLSFWSFTPTVGCGGAPTAPRSQPCSGNQALLACLA